jgi:hypothetical protein
MNMHGAIGADRYRQDNLPVLIQRFSFFGLCLCISWVDMTVIRFWQM